jgi:GT2 family glycosyltransferase
MTGDGVTVVIPVYGKSGLTRSCLDTLLGQDLPAGTRLIVVDDASPDDTMQMLAAYADQVQVLALATNVGFGSACNAGVAAAETDLVVLLNNDTTPHDGWLAALLRHASEHPAAAAIGARLLHLDGTVQHAGVVIGHDRLPHHVYAGFPGDHPAVTRSRQFQVVTGACLLVRRGVFLGEGGFDVRYRNGHEDVDLCLRLGAAGHEVRYCADAVLTHLESASRGRRSVDEVANSLRWCDQWQASVRPDDLEVYAGDGLLKISYDSDATPLAAEVSILLATLERRERAREVEQLLRQRTRQVHELLQDAVRLTVLAATGAGHSAPPASSPASALPVVDGLALAGLLVDSHAPILDRDDRVQEALAALQLALASRLDDAFTPHPGPAYRGLVRRVRAAVELTILQRRTFSSSAVATGTCSTSEAVRHSTSRQIPTASTPASTRSTATRPCSTCSTSRQLGRPTWYCRPRLSGGSTTTPSSPATWRPSCRSCSTTPATARSTP